MPLSFAWTESPPGGEALRREVRDFLEAERSGGRFEPRSNAWLAFNRDFSRRCGERGYIGMTWPARYGGHERSMLEQYVVTEELLAGGAPVSAHWLADRQIGPQLLRFGSEGVKAALLPRIARGEICFAVGMSEPNAGSDLAALRTRAERVEGGWRITGAKVWTTNAHRADYMNVLARTNPGSADRRQGLTQFVVGLPDPAVAVSPIHNIAGQHEFNEVRFDGCFVADDFVLGQPGEGWKIVTAELALERSGPDRLLSSFDLLRRLVERLGAAPDALEATTLGRLVAEVATLRHLSRSVAGMIAAGRSPVAEAALVKDLGTLHEQAVPEAARLLLACRPALASDDGFLAALGEQLLSSPSFTLRGGTTEILRTVAARELT